MLSGSRKKYYGTACMVIILTVIICLLIITFFFLFLPYFIFLFDKQYNMYNAYNTIKLN